MRKNLFINISTYKHISIRSNILIKLTIHCATMRLTL